MELKHFILAGAIALCASLHAAETNSITTRDGTTYTNAVIQRADPNGIVIEYAPAPGSVGIAKLKFANLPADLQPRYNYNATNAQIFEQNQQSANLRRFVEDERAKREAELERERQRVELLRREAYEAELAAENQRQADAEKKRLAAEAEAKRLADAQALRDWWDYGLRANLLRDLSPKKE